MPFRETGNTLLSASCCHVSTITCTYLSLCPSREPVSGQLLMSVMSLCPDHPSVTTMISYSSVVIVSHVFFTLQHSYL